ncbi:MAG: DUF1015 family protein [Butyrivibrio sp.]|jgi:uncharacterized protein (DUF1015 family)|nr:DUF1015 family protein [Butyrivibrio sp.]
MAQIRPFKAIRPQGAYASRVAALPYDVYNREEARKETAREPMSFLTIDRPETQFAPDCDMYADRVYQKAHDMLRDRIAEGTFEQDETAEYYIYEQNMDGRIQTGIVGCAAIDDYINGVIRKHENTRQEKEQDRIRHVDACNAQTGPIFLCYRENRVIDACVEKICHTQKTLYEFTSSDQVHNRIWAVNHKEDISLLQNAFAGMQEIYIADGHHRCASAVKVGLSRRAQDMHPTGQKEYDFFLSVLFPDSQLMIMDYNRVVKDLNGLDTETFMKKISAKFDVMKMQNSPVKPEGKGMFGMYLDEHWYLLKAHEDIRKDDAVDGLDVSVLQNELLGPVLGIGDPRTDERIDFIGGIRGLSELERRCHEDMRVAFAMFPTSIHELFAVADAGRLMPPKSTWFEPKLLSGLFIHAINDKI